MTNKVKNPHAVALGKRNHALLKKRLGKKGYSDYQKEISNKRKAKKVIHSLI